MLFLRLGKMKNIHAAYLIFTGAALKLLLLSFACKNNITAILFFTIEFMIITIGIYLLKNKFKLLLLPLGIISLLQVVNMAATGNLIETETILNINEGSSLDCFFKLKLTILFVIGCASFVLDLFVPNIRLHKRKLACGLAIILAVVEMLPGAPLYSCAETIYSVFEVLFTPQPDYSTGESFKHETIIDSGISLKLKSRNKNIILIFAEGTGIYCLSEKLTPNVYGLSKESISFKNYFNHTAFTFRGIRGQLISGYPLLGGSVLEKKVTAEEMKKFYSTSLPTLPDILNRHDYKTVFLSPHPQYENLGEVVRQSGIQHIKYAEDFGCTENLTDRKQYQNIWQELQKLETSGERFFLSAYILGTHHGMDSPDVKYGDGKNPYLNKFYNQDHWFGEFFKKFKQSKLAENTILIWTSDHFIYPTREYRETFNRNDQFYVGRIPLFIYHRDFPAKSIDPGIRNSLSLAPTILDLLGIHNEKNYFLGNSLFVSQQTEYDNIAVSGKKVFLIRLDGSVVYCRKESKILDRFYRNRFLEYYKFIQ